MIDYTALLRFGTVLASASCAFATYCNDLRDCYGDEGWCCSNECCSWERYTGHSWNEDTEEIVRKGVVLATWIIVVIVIVIILAIIGCIVGCVLCCRRKNQQPGRVITQTHVHAAGPPPGQAYPMGPAPGYAPPGQPQPTPMPYPQPGYPTGQPGYPPAQPGQPAGKQPYPDAAYPAQPPNYQATQQQPPPTTDYSQASAPPAY